MNAHLSVPARRFSLVAFLVLAFVLAWGAWIPAALGLFPVTLAGLAGAWGPSLAGIAMTAADSGRDGLRVLFRRLSQWRVGVQWYLFVLLWPAVLSIAVTGISILLGSAPPDFSNPPVVSVYPAPPEAFAAGFLPLLPLVFVTQLFGSSLGEEIGWRGFALPRLQRRHSALISSLVLGLVWGIWHMPRIWVPGDPIGLAGLWWLVLGLVLNAVFYTWIFNSTGGSLIPVLLLHTTQAVTSLFLSELPNPGLKHALMAVVATTVLVRFGASRMTD